MAKYVSGAAAPVPMPPMGGRSSWEPGEGMTFTTVRLQRVVLADVIVEHEEGLSGDEVSARVKAHLPQLVDHAEWWCPESETTAAKTIFLGNADPENEGEPVTDEPYELSAPEATPDPEVIG